MPQLAPKRVPTVVAGTAPAQTQETALRFAEAVAATNVDERVWAGAFATNVWGGRYAIDGVLGQGGQGCTFAGTDLKTGGRVAVKILDLKSTTDWKAVELFDREVQALQSIAHPRIPSFLDVLKDDETGARALVMSLVPGDDLDRVMKADGPLGEAAIWHALVDVTDVLAALHGRASPMLHRDIKPKNLVRRPDGSIAVVDLGGVGHVRGVAGSTVVGTFGYMAPEQLYGTQTPATDLYALGATMLTLATGKEPEDHPRAGLALDVDKAAPHLSAPLRTILKRLLAPDPTQRPADARAFMAELQEVARTKQAPRVEPSSVEPGGLSASLDDQGANAMLAMLQVLVGVVGSVAVALFGQVLLPLLFTILAGFSNRADQKARLLALRRSVDEQARYARQGFMETARRGAGTFETLNRRDKDRRRIQKAQRKAEREMWRHQRRQRR